MDYQQAITVFASLIAIMNPLANAPIFLALTEQETNKVQKQIAFWSVATAVMILTPVVFFGDAILKVFGVSVDAVRIAGGVLLGWIGFQMLQGGYAGSHSTRASGDTSTQLNVAISPLGIPILAGPGSIAAITSFCIGKTLDYKVGVALIVLACCALSLVAFLAGERMTKFLGPHANQAISKMMGMLLAVIGVQMILFGTKNWFY